MDENNNQATSEINEVSNVETMDDLDNLLAEEGEKKVSTPAPKAEEEPKQEGTDTKESEPTETVAPKKPTDGGRVTENNISKADNAFAAMRTELKKYETMMKNLADARRISVEELTNQLGKEAVEKKAEQLNMTPEVYERLSKLEEDNKVKAAELEALKNERYRDAQTKRLTANIEQVQKEQGLSDNQVREFVEETVSQGMDILKGNVPLNILYKGMKYDELVKAEVEKAKQEVIAQYSKADKYAASTVKSSGNADKDVNSITDMAALDALFGNK